MTPNTAMRPGRCAPAGLPGGWLLPEDLLALRAATAPTASFGIPAQRIAPVGCPPRGTWVIPPPRITRSIGVELLPVGSTVDPAMPSDAAVERVRSAQPTTTAGIRSKVEPGRSSSARWSRPVLVCAAAVAIAVGVGAPTFGEDTRSLTVTVDGHPRIFTTAAGTVAEALASVGIPVGAHDVLAPGPNAPVGEGSAITIRRGRLVTVDLDHHRRQLWTTATTVDQALVELGLNVQDYRISADRSRRIGPDGIRLTGQKLHTVMLVDGAGAPRSVRAPGGRVTDVLAAQDISLTARDKVAPALGTTIADGERIIVTRIQVSNRIVSRKIGQPAPTAVEADTLDRGNTKIANPGIDGQRNLTIRRTTVNGRSIEKVIANTVVRKAQAKVTEVGTRESGLPDSWSVPWDRMAFCESTSRWSVNTGNGTYGGLQFMTSTWLEYGGEEFASRADLATKEQQIIVAERLYAKEGLAPWHCARLLGWGFGKYQG
jgi:uncharacterized protein YabE (DUF348 family)